MRRKGFTLIELLVVIAIIAILAAILFPVFAKAREKARQTMCLSHIKQVALVIMMYAQDYDEAFPREFQWGLAVFPYVKNYEIGHCPSARKGTGRGTPPTNTQLDYAYNNFLCTQCGNWPQPYTLVKMGSVVVPSSCVMLYDVITPWVPENNRFWTWYDSLGDVYLNNVYDRHNGGGNIALVDGHSKWYKQDLQSYTGGVYTRWGITMWWNTTP